jgi:hypothetical protein
MFSKSTFSTGGFVVHGITGAFSGRVSAWFDANGNPLDAEQIIQRNGRPISRPVRRDGPMWDRLRRHGSIYASAGDF